MKYEQYIAEFGLYTVDHEVDDRRNLNKVTTFTIWAWSKYMITAENDKADDEKPRQSGNIENMYQQDDLII